MPREFAKTASGAVVPEKRDKCGMRTRGLLSLLSGWRTAAVLGSLLVTCWPPGLAAAPRGDALAGNASRHARYVGMEYEVWFPGIPAQGPYGGEHYWEPRWGTPLLGTYDSTDPKVVDKHAEWLTAIGVDFVLIDWANNIANALSGPTIVGDTIRERTNSVFQEYHDLQQRGAPHPRIAILLGAQNQNGVAAQDAISSGSLNREADYVYDHFVSKDPGLYFQYKGKPLLVIYLGTPAALNPPPSWSDPRFTVRWMSGFLESQPALYNGLPAKNRFWSWMDRSPTPAGYGSPAAATSARRPRRREHVQYPMAQGRTLCTRHHLVESMERVQQSGPLRTWYGRRVYDRTVERSRADPRTRMPANSRGPEGRQLMEKSQSGADQLHNSLGWDLGTRSGDDPR
jgi:hypothetical protein